MEDDGTEGSGCRPERSEGSLPYQGALSIQMSHLAE